MEYDYLKLAVVSILRTMGREMDEESFVKYFSYGKSWISPVYARRLFKACIDANLLKKEGDKYVPNFEFKGVIPLDFRITPEIVDKYTVKEDVFTRILDKICHEEGIERKDALSRVNKVRNEIKFVNVEVASLIYCRERGIECKEFYEEVERKLVM